MVTVVLAFVLIPVTASSSAYGQEFPGAQDEQAINVRIYPADFWGPRVGPGVGVGVVSHSVARQYDQWLATVAPALHEQVATLSFASANPHRARRYVLVDTRGLHSDRDWYGPPDDRIILRRSSLRARIRTGQSLGNGRFLIQPRATFVYQDVTDVDAPIPLPSGNANGTPISVEEGGRNGIRAGVDLRLDTRVRPRDDRTGLRLQATWDRYFPVDESGLRFDQVDVDAYGFLALGGRHRLVLRTAATLTRSRTDTVVPIYMLPTLGTAEIPGWTRRRFVGRDRLFGSLLYQFPLWRWGDALVVEGHAGGHLGSVYEDLVNQFSPSISFDEELPSDADSPLRPAASLGLRLGTPLRHDAQLDFAVGVSPEGLSAVQFSIVRSLQAIRMPHHTTATTR